MCSVISLNAGNVLATARNMDFNFGMVGRRSMFVPAGSKVTFLKTVDVQMNKSVKTICNFLNETAALNNFLIWQEAINEDGLSFSLLFNVDNSAHVSLSQGNDESLLGWPAKMLSNYTKVSDVKAAITKDTRFHVPTGAGNFATCHFYFADQDGKAIVIEMHNGYPKVYDCPIGVMTNGPEYDWHMTNLRNYLNVSPNGIDKRDWPNEMKKDENNKDVPVYNYSKIGHGDGFLGVPGGNGSPDRFIRIALNKLWATEITEKNAPAKAAALVGLGYTAMGTQNSQNGGDKDQTLWTSLKWFDKSKTNIDERIRFFVKETEQYNFVEIAGSKQASE